MSQATALHNVGSSNYLAGAAVLPLQQRAGIAELPTSQAGESLPKRIWTGAICFSADGKFRPASRCIEQHVCSCAKVCWMGRLRAVACRAHKICMRYVASGKARLLLVRQSTRPKPQLRREVQTCRWASRRRQAASVAVSGLTRSLARLTAPSWALYWTTGSARSTRSNPARSRRLWR